MDRPFLSPLPVLGGLLGAGLAALAYFTPSIVGDIEFPFFIPLIGGVSAFGLALGARADGRFTRPGATMPYSITASLCTAVGFLAGKYMLFVHVAREAIRQEQGPAIASTVKLFSSEAAGFFLTNIVRMFGGWDVPLLGLAVLAAWFATADRLKALREEIQEEAPRVEGHEFDPVIGSRALFVSLSVAALAILPVGGWLVDKAGRADSVLAVDSSTEAIPSAGVAPQVRALHRLSNDFDEPSGVFVNFTEKYGAGKYADGGYLLELTDPSVPVWAWAMGDRSWRAGLSVAADLTQQVGPKVPIYAGVMALFTESTGYQFQIGRDGSYGLYKVIESSSDNSYWRLAEGELSHRLRKTNRLRLEVSGGGAVPTVLRIYVNDELVDTARDHDGHDPFSGVGLFVESDSGEAVVLFDNLEVREL